MPIARSAPARVGPSSTSPASCIVRWTYLGSEGSEPPAFLVRSDVKYRNNSGATAELARVLLDRMVRRGKADTSQIAARRVADFALSMLVLDTRTPFAVGFCRSGSANRRGNKDRGCAYSPRGHL